MLKHQKYITSQFATLGILLLCSTLTSCNLINQNSKFPNIFNIKPKKTIPDSDRIPSLIQTLQNKNEDQWIRASAAQLLGETASEDETVISALIKVLQDETESAWLRDTATEALGRIGLAAVPSLIQVLQEDKQAYSNVILALSSIGSAAVPSLIQVLQQGDEQTRLSAIEVLGNVKPNSQDAIAALVQALQDKYEEIRYAAATVLAEIDPDAEEAVPILIKALQDDNVEIRISAAEAVGKIGSAAQDAVPVLIQILQSNYESDKIRISAAEAIRKIDSAAVPTLIQALQNNNTRYSAAYALSVIDSLPQEAVDALQEVVNNKNNELKVRWMAAVALENAGSNMQDFFVANNLISPQNVKCPEDKNFDVYARQCTYQLSYQSFRDMFQVLRNRIAERSRRR